MKANLELWLVRHGETTFSATKRVAGWSDPPLTAVGRRQAADLREVLDGREFVGVWSSDLEECHFGDIEGCTYDEADADYGEVFRAFRGFSTPGGESHLQLHDRVCEFIEGLESGRHLLFAHGGVIRFVHEPGNSDRAD